MYSNDPSCRAFDALLVRSDLAADESAALRGHLADCAACREAAALLTPWLDGDDPVLPVGTRVDSFVLETPIGRGGSSTVYRAAHPLTGQRVAIKVLHRRMLAARDAVERFTRDARLIAQLRGAHICRVYTFGTLATGEPYMVLELLDGEDLLARIERDVRLSVEIAIDFVLQACAGLAEAHARGIVHRDLKPANLFCVQQPDGSPLIKVLDFGIAKLPPDAEAESLTETGAKLGSVPYMSPEQLRSSRGVDVRSDVWSLGATLHHLISGRLPFGDDGALAEMTLRIWTEAPRPLPGAPPGLADVVMRCLSRRADDRFADVAALAEALAPFGDVSAETSAARVRRILQGAVAAK